MSFCFEQALELLYNFLSFRVGAHRGRALILGMCLYIFPNLRVIYIEEIQEVFYTVLFLILLFIAQVTLKNK